MTQICAPTRQVAHASEAVNRTDVQLEFVLDEQRGSFREERALEKALSSVFGVGSASSAKVLSLVQIRGGEFAASPR